jgi:hypothetical protein
LVVGVLVFLKQGDLGVEAAAGRMEQKTPEVLFTFDYMSI